MLSSYAFSSGSLSSRGWVGQRYWVIFSSAPMLSAAPWAQRLIRSTARRVFHSWSQRM